MVLIPRAGIGVGAAALVAALSGQAAQGATETRSFIGGSDGKRIYDMPFMKLLGAETNGKFKNLQSVISACYCGGFAEAAEKYLDGKYSVAVIRDTKNEAKMQRIATVNNQPVWKGETGYQTGASNFYVFGWDAQWNKKLDASPDSTAKQLFDEATAKEFDTAHQKNGFPKLVSKNSGETEKVKVDQGKGEAIVWDNFDSDFFYSTYVTLQRRGYSDGTKANARIDSAFDVFSNTNFGGNNTDINGAEPPAQVDRKADGTSLKAMVQGLGTRLAADNGNKTAFVYVGGHGNVEKVKDEKLPNASEGLAAQGKRITDGEGTSLELDSEFVAQLFEGTGIITDGTARVLPASIGVRTFSEDFAGDVEVLLDGVSVGLMSIGGTPTGGDYALSIPDSVMLDLYAQGLLNDLQADITFEFPLGVPSIDGFQVATSWDFDLGLTEYYGIGLAAPSVWVPAPGAGLAVALGLSGALRRRRTL